MDLIVRDLPGGVLPEENVGQGLALLAEPCESFFKNPFHQLNITALGELGQIWVLETLGKNHLLVNQDLLEIAEEEL